jgi:hypothetical protein
MIRTGAKITKKYDLSATPYERVLADEGTIRKLMKTRLKRENKPLNPAQSNVRFKPSALN